MFVDTMEIKYTMNGQLYPRPLTRKAQRKKLSEAKLTKNRTIGVNRCRVICFFYDEDNTTKETKRVEKDIWVPPEPYHDDDMV